MITQTNTTKKSTINMHLSKGLLLANISLNKLSNKVYQIFLESYTKKGILYETTLRKEYIHDSFIETKQKIKEYTSDYKIWISIDIMTDAEDRLIANIIIGTLETEEQEKTNHSTVSKLFDKLLFILWLDGIRNDELMMLYCFCQMQH